MRCYICDKLLEPEEIILDKKTGKFKPCSKCEGVVTRTVRDSQLEDVLKY